MRSGRLKCVVRLRTSALRQERAWGEERMFTLSKEGRFCLQRRTWSKLKSNIGIGIGIVIVTPVL